MKARLAVILSLSLTRRKLLFSGISFLWGNDIHSELLRYYGTWKTLQLSSHFLSLTFLSVFWESGEQDVPFFIPSVFKMSLSQEDIQKRDVRQEGNRKRSNACRCQFWDVREAEEGRGVGGINGEYIVNDRKEEQIWDNVKGKDRNWWKNVAEKRSDKNLEQKPTVAPAAVWRVSPLRQM